MHTPVLNQVEEMIRHLSRNEQLWLIEQLVHHLRGSSTKSATLEQTTFNTQLTAMAADTEIQAELQKINREFAVTEVNGLEGK